VNPCRLISRKGEQVSSSEVFFSQLLFMPVHNRRSPKRSQLWFVKIPHRSDLGDTLAASMCAVKARIESKYFP